MKYKITLLFIAFTSLCNAQTVNIPDINFKNALISSLCVDADLNGTYESDADLNNDGQIQTSEASIIQRLKVSNKNISDLNGIQSFTSLKKILCSNNVLTTVDFSSNLSLQQIDCYSNSFVSLTINGLPLLNSLNIYPNSSLQNLIVTNNPSLTTLLVGNSFGSIISLVSLNCSYNALTSLDLYFGSALSNLTSLNCSNNQINVLDLTSTNLNILNLSNNNMSIINNFYDALDNMNTLDISNNNFVTFNVDYPSLINFNCINNPITTLTFNQFSNNPITISNLLTLQSLYFGYNITVPSINLSLLPNLNSLNVNYSTIQNGLVLADLPSLNAIVFNSPNSNLTLANNLGFTSIDSGFNTPNTLNFIANNLHITNLSSVSNINLITPEVANITIDNLANLVSLKFPVCENLQGISLNTLPQLQTLEIGINDSYIENINCIDLVLQNFNNLTSIHLSRIRLNSLILNSLPALTSFIHEGSSCSVTTSNFTLTNLPLLYDAKILDSKLSNLNINNLNSLHSLEIFSTELLSLNLNTLPQLYDLIFTTKYTSPNVVLPQLSIQNLPNLYSIYLNRVDIGGLSLLNLPNLFSLISTNEYPGTSYIPTQINYNISNLPNLNYVQLDQIKTTNLVFSNLPSFNTLKMENSSIGNNYSFQNLPLESIYMDRIASLNSLNFNNLPSFKNLSLTNSSNIQYLNLENVKSTLQTFELYTENAIPSGSISSINFTDFTQLTSLIAKYSLTSLPLVNLPNLTFLNCSSNKFNSLTVSNLPQLSTMVCNYIQPTNNTVFLLSLNLPQLTSLNVNYCNDKLKSLDLSQCPNINELHFLLYNYTFSGQIQYVNLKNGNSNLNIFESNPINNICVDDIAEKNLLQSLNDNVENTIFTTYCSFNPGGTFYTLKGSNLLDINNNGCDSNDLLFPMINLSINNGSTTNSYFGNNTGNYLIPLTAGQYSITPLFENPSYYTFSPSSITVDFQTQTSPMIQNFCITPNGNHNDLEITILPLTPARPGFDATYKLVYKNKGNQVQSGNIDLTFNDSVLDFVSASQTAAGQTANLLHWIFTNLQPFETRTINVVFNINSPTENPPVISGTILNFGSEIIGLTDETPNDNISNLSQTVVNAYDPNDKTCLEGQIVSTNIIGEYVHYMIRFQNTGTANAQNIIVKDMIDLAKFDITTLIPINGSHSFFTRKTNSNQVEFIFQNINLPFTSGNNNGYISFKIKTKPTLTVGDTFSNQVNIYFDYNNPIVTNNYVTSIQTLGVNETQTKNKISTYPNPIKDIIYFNTEKNVIKIEVYDTTGRILSSNTINENKANLSELKTGNYFLKIYTEIGISITKIIKQ